MDIFFRRHKVELAKLFLAAGLDGRCSWRPNRIQIGTHCRGFRELDTLIHEMLHALRPSWPEGQVAKAATDLANTLWMWGYRKVGKTKGRRPRVKYLKPPRRKGRKGR